MIKKNYQFSHIELAIIIGCIARCQAEVELLSDRFMTDFKSDLEKILEKLENLNRD